MRTGKGHRLLIVECEASLRAELEILFADLDLTSVAGFEDVPVLVRRFEPEVVLLGMGARSEADTAAGLETLAQVLALAPETKVITMIAQNARELAVKAVGLGAWNFYHKPVDRAILSILVRRALRIRELEQENLRLRAQTGAPALEGLIGASSPMREICRSIEKVAPTHATVLLLGESGTGKELIARALHKFSGRVSKPFVAINCAAIPDALLESELFGYEKGAFTGAMRRTAGKLEIANEGTVFLDEIGEMPPALQAKLLRVVQERVIERVGGHTPVPLNLRIVSATNKDLERLIQSGGFREDLFYRLNEVMIRIPPLRDRENDSLVLAQLLLRQQCESFGKPMRAFSPDAISAIQNHSWPGNVRELENRIKGAVIMAEGERVTACDLGLQQTQAVPGHLNLRMARQRAESQALRQALAVAKGNMTRAAQLLGVTRPTLYDLLKKYPEHVDVADADTAPVPARRAAASST